MTPHDEATDTMAGGTITDTYGARPSFLTLARRLFGAEAVSAEDIASAEAFDLPGADLSSEEVTEQVLAAQADEFTCASCFLVRHRSQIAHDRGGQLFCTECEG